MQKHKYKNHLSITSELKWVSVWMIAIKPYNKLWKLSELLPEIRYYSPVLCNKIIIIIKSSNISCSTPYPTIFSRKWHLVSNTNKKTVVSSTWVVLSAFQTKKSIALRLHTVLEERRHIHFILFSLHTHHKTSMCLSPWQFKNHYNASPYTSLQAMGHRQCNCHSFKSAWFILDITAVWK